MNAYQILIRFRENGRHRRLEVAAPDSDMLYQRIAFILQGQPVYDVVSVVLDGQELIVDENGDPVSDQARMQEASLRNNSRKRALSIIRDWDRGSWSEQLLQRDAYSLVAGRADLRDLNPAQLQRIEAIAGII